MTRRLLNRNLIAMAAIAYAALREARLAKGLIARWMIVEAVVAIGAGAVRPGRHSMRLAPVTPAGTIAADNLPQAPHVKRERLGFTLGRSACDPRSALRHQAMSELGWPAR